MEFDIEKIYFSPRAMEAIRAVRGPIGIADVKRLVRFNSWLIGADAAIRMTGGATPYRENVFQLWVDRKHGQRVLEYRVDRREPGRLMLWDVHDVLHPVTTTPTTDYEVMT